MKYRDEALPLLGVLTAFRDNNLVATQTQHKLQPDQNRPAQTADSYKLWLVMIKILPQTVTNYGW